MIKSSKFDFYVQTIMISLYTQRIDMRLYSSYDCNSELLNH